MRDDFRKKIGLKASMGRKLGLNSPVQSMHVAPIDIDKLWLPNAAMTTRNSFWNLRPRMKRAFLITNYFFPSWARPKWLIRIGFRLAMVCDGIVDYQFSHWQAIQDVFEEKLGRHYRSGQNSQNNFDLMNVCCIYASALYQLHCRLQVPIQVWKTAMPSIILRT